MKFSESVYAGSSKKLPRVYNSLHASYLCDKLVLHLPEHLQEHNNVPYVHAILNSTNNYRFEEIRAKRNDKHKFCFCLRVWPVPRMPLLDEALILQNPPESMCFSKALASRSTTHNTRESQYQTWRPEWCRHQSWWGGPASRSTTNNTKRKAEFHRWQHGGKKYNRWDQEIPLA